MSERLQQFRSGNVNLLVTTAVAEEGLDVPRANHVIRFDRVRHVVARVQGQGRAREHGARHVLLQNNAEEVDRFDEAIEIGRRVAAKYRPSDQFAEVEAKISANLKRRPTYSRHGFEDEETLFSLQDSEVK
jgi:ERCC4-related helicase